MMAAAVSMCQLMKIAEQASAQDPADTRGECRRMHQRKRLRRERPDDKAAAVLDRQTNELTDATQNVC